MTADGLPASQGDDRSLDAAGRRPASRSIGKRKASNTPSGRWTRCRISSRPTSGVTSSRGWSNGLTAHRSDPQGRLHRSSSVLRDRIIDPHACLVPRGLLLPPTSSWAARCPAISTSTFTAYRPGARQRRALTWCSKTTAARRRASATCCRIGRCSKRVFP